MTKTLNNLPRIALDKHIWTPLWALRFLHRNYGGLFMVNYLLDKFAEQLPSSLTTDMHDWVKYRNKTIDKHKATVASANETPSIKQIEQRILFTKGCISVLGYILFAHDSATSISPITISKLKHLLDVKHKQLGRYSTILTNGGLYHL